MIDVDFIRENPEKVKKAVAAKQLDSKIVDEFLRSDKKWRAALLELEDLRREKNEFGKGDSDKGKGIKAKIKDLEPKAAKEEEERRQLLSAIPNLPADDVPIGKDESGNAEVKEWGEVKKFDFNPKDNLEIAKSLGLIDVERAAKVAGTRFGYLKGEAVLLEFALVQLTLKTLVKEGFIPVVPPVLIHPDITAGLGYWQGGGSGDYYLIREPDQAEPAFYLVGTAEHALVPMHKDEVFKSEELPRRYVGFSTCFRREAGSYGKDTKGIFRVHQFDKLEMVSFIKPQKEADLEEHDYLLSLAEKLVQTLKLPYQVTKMCTGDLGFPIARKYDLNCWFPSEGKYRETHSISTTTDFQARRLNIKYEESGKKDFVHVLNGTAFAIGRILLAIFENYQQKDGSIAVPEALVPFTGFEVIKPK